ncbi:hypothetical protein HY837_04830 [archaeon]|nr:hypothetical protein [archaeon]
MGLSEFKKSIKEASTALDQALSNKVDFESDAKTTPLLDYKGIQKEYYKRNFRQMIVMLEKQSLGIQELAGLNENNARIINDVNTCTNELKNTSKASALRELIDDLAYYAEQLKETSSIKIQVNSNLLPDEIKSEILADIQETGLCFNAGCYRSAIILCGRILETALHRIHYDLTKNDLLEKSPGLGIGNLVAKIKEKGIELDPGLGNQVHLINQMRIYSVHKKQTAFEPSKTQAHAIILYTLDILDKLFK